MAVGWCAHQLGNQLIGVAMLYNNENEESSTRTGDGARTLNSNSRCCWLLPFIVSRTNETEQKNDLPSFSAFVLIHIYVLLLGSKWVELIDSWRQRRCLRHILEMKLKLIVTQNERRVAIKRCAKTEINQSEKSILDLSFASFTLTKCVCANECIICACFWKWNKCRSAQRPATLATAKALIETYSESNFVSTTSQLGVHMTSTTAPSLSLSWQRQIDVYSKHHNFFSVFYDVLMIVFSALALYLTRNRRPLHHIAFT